MESSGSGVASGGEGRRGEGYELCLSPHYSWLQNLVRVVPFARGFERKEKLREVDVLIRRYVAGRVDEAVRELEAARSLVAGMATQAFFSATPMLSPVPSFPTSPASAQAVQLQPVISEQLRTLINDASNISSDILYADSGWAPVGAAKAVREEEILKLCEYDDSMVGLGEAAAKLAKELREAVAAGDLQGALSKVGEVREVLNSLRQLYEERRKYLHFTTHKGGISTALASAGEAAVKGLGAALTKAREVLSKVFKR